MQGLFTSKGVQVVLAGNRPEAKRVPSHELVSAKKFDAASHSAHG